MKGLFYSHFKHDSSHQNAISNHSSHCVHTVNHFTCIQLHTHIVKSHKQELFSVQWAMYVVSMHFVPTLYLPNLHTLYHIPVSYTHLDVYKRQGLYWLTLLFMWTD